MQTEKPTCPRCIHGNKTPTEMPCLQCEIIWKPPYHGKRNCFEPVTPSEEKVN